MYRFAICDNDPQQVMQMIRRWANHKRYVSETACFSSSEAFLFLYEEDKTFDILLLDIEMVGMNGVELARKIRSENKEAQIIFVTGYMEYKSDGYDVEDLHFLIKPINEAKLFEVLDRAVVKLRHNGRALLLDQNDESVRVPLYEIRYLDVQPNYVTVHANEDITVRATLSDLETKLDEDFMRLVWAGHL